MARETGTLIVDFLPLPLLLQIQSPSLTSNCVAGNSCGMPSSLPPSPADHTELLLQPSSPSMGFSQPPAPAAIPWVPASQASQRSREAEKHGIVTRVGAPGSHRDERNRYMRLSLRILSICLQQPLRLVLGPSIVS